MNHFCIGYHWINHVVYINKDEATKPIAKWYFHYCFCSRLRLITSKLLTPGPPSVKNHRKKHRHFWRCHPPINITPCEWIDFGKSSNPINPHLDPVWTVSLQAKSPQCVAKTSQNLGLSHSVSPGMLGASWQQTDGKTTGTCEEKTDQPRMAHEKVLFF